jgi:hypothetical protein
MTKRSEKFEVFVAPTLWASTVLAICVFAHHDPAYFKTWHSQAEALATKNTGDLIIGPPIAHEAPDFRKFA